MTDWFKNNPFLATLGALAAVVLVAGGYFLFAELGRLDEEQSSFDQKKTQLQRLQGNKPYPNEANLEAARKEVEEATLLLQQITKELAIDVPSATPQAFQDELAGMVKDVTEKASAKQIDLPEKFYLGFELYETQLPAADIVPRLSLQLRSIHAVVVAALESRIKSLGAVARAPVSGEKGPAPETDGADGSLDKKPGSESPALEIVPFDVSFTADQSAFRTAFNRISELQPPVFVRLVDIENSSPLPPSKTAPPEPANTEADQRVSQSDIRPIVGRETLKISLSLASVVGSTPPAP